MYYYTSDLHGPINISENVGKKTLLVSDGKVLKTYQINRLQA